MTFYFIEMVGYICGMVGLLTGNAWLIVVATIIVLGCLFYSLAKNGKDFN